MGSGAVGKLTNTINPINAFEGFKKNPLDPAGLFNKDPQAPLAPGEFDGVYAPTRPDYQSTMDDKTGLLKSQYNLPDWQNISPDSAGYNQVKQNALETGPSSWAKAATEQQRLGEQGLNQAAQEQNASAGAQARSSLAQKYGLSSGANTSLARQQMKNNANSLQNVGFQGAQARAGINTADQQRKDTMLQSLTGLDTSNAQLGMQNEQNGLQAKQYNIGNALTENQNKNAQNLAAYQAQMQAWGAGKTADATRAAGANAGSGGKK